MKTILDNVVQCYGGWKRTRIWSAVQTYCFPQHEIGNLQVPFRGSSTRQSSLPSCGAQTPWGVKAVPACWLEGAVQEEFNEAGWKRWSSIHYSSALMGSKNMQSNTVFYMALPDCNCILKMNSSRCAYTVGWEGNEQWDSRNQRNTRACSSEAMLQFPWLLLSAWLLISEKNDSCFLW